MHVADHWLLLHTDILGDSTDIGTLQRVQHMLTSRNA